jgi:hypothetical protein
MENPDAQLERTIAATARLTAPGVLAFYSHVEVTEIFAVRDNDPTPLNVFSILVAEERVGSAAEKPVFLGQPIRLKSLHGWMFGIQQFVRPISKLEQAFRQFREAGEWRPSGKPLHVGPLVPVPMQFVPPDSTIYAPWNNVLKNNFWSGSHIIEWADPKKLTLKPLLEEPSRLSELSDAIQKQVPIRLAGLSDRLGNVAVQLPVTIIISTFAHNRLTGDAIVNIRWHPKATARPLRASSEMQFDNMISGYASATIQEPETTLPMAGGQGMLRGVLWDDQHQVVLAATGSTSFFTTIALNMIIPEPEPRVFTITAKDGSREQVRVGILNTSENPVKAPAIDRGEDWTKDRIYRDDATRLASERRFVQYKPEPGQQAAEHERALQDIRRLLNQYGKAGAWLWDPYLNADDLISTLFYCGHRNADLRALTAGREPPSSKTALPFIETQRATLNAAASNPRALRLEYRVKVGPAGWPFHDRFLIFPKTEGSALAWSLGTSVNSLGNQHHILLQVDDGQLVANAFEELWEQLNQLQHLVWKTP